MHDVLSFNARDIARAMRASDLKIDIRTDDEFGTSFSLHSIEQTQFDVSFMTMFRGQ